MAWAASATGVLLAAYAVGGVLGSLVAVRAGRWLGTGTIIVGGVLGRALGLRAPFLLGAAVLAVTALLALPRVNNRTVRAARVAAGAAPSTG